MFDVLIVGGGVAGLSAALMLGRSCRGAVVVDGGQPRNAPAAQMHNVLTRDGTAPGEFHRLALHELTAYPSLSLRTGEVTRVQRGARGFEAVLADGAVVAARRVLLATGLADVLPAVPGISDLWGVSVFHCPYCHGWETRGSTVAVQGAGPARVRLALQLTRFSPDVVLCTDGDSLDDTATAILSQAGVVIRAEPLAELTVHDGRLAEVRFTGGPSLARDALFVDNTTTQRSELAVALGCAHLADGGIEVDEFGRTSVAGIYAAGDMAHRSALPMPLASVTAAGAAGQVAAGALDQDLLCEDFGLPNPLDAMSAR